MRELDIAIEALDEGRSIHLSERVGAELVATGEEQLRFPEEVELAAEVYRVGEHLVLQFDASTAVELPCAICNQWVRVPLEVKSAQVVCDVSEVPHGIWNIGEAVREALLLEIPAFVECGDSCPERAFLAPYLRPSDKRDEHRPFSDL